MRSRATARAVVLATAVVTEAAGFAMVALPATAAPRTFHGTITATAGGDRTTSNGISGTGHVRFSEQHATPSTCTTGPNGSCSLTVHTGDHRVFQESAPGGWFLSRELGISPNSYTSSVAARDYSSVTVSVPSSGAGVPSSTSGSTTNPAARSGVWAVSRDNPGLPANCGLNVALLSDLSSSVDGHLRDLQDAAIGFVNALDGTPSSVALFTFGTHAPVNSTNNSNYPLTPLTTNANVSALTSKIRGYTIMTHPAQYTNWDAGLWQVASGEGSPGGRRVHYDAAVVLTDGDPTVYGPIGIGQTHTAITRFIDIENGIFSANALKAKHTQVIAVGINAAGASVLNLKAISGPVAGRDYFTTNFAGLGAILRALALANCSGTVNVTKMVIPGNRQHDIAAAVPAPGWAMHAAGLTVRPKAGVTDQTGAVSFATSSLNTQVAVTEEVKSGYTHFPVDRENAACVNLAGRPVPVTDAGTGPGFTVSAHANDIITCQVYNQQAAPSEITTRLSAADGEIGAGGRASDSATLREVTATAGGTVRYRFYDSRPACDHDTAAFPGTAPSGGTPVSTETVTRGRVPRSAARRFPATGTVYWAAFYSGDDANRPVASDCVTEPLLITPSPARITTALSAAGRQIGVGGSVSDSATLREVTATAGGTVRYRFYDSLAACDRDTAAYPGTTPSGGTLVSTAAVTRGTVPDSSAHAFPVAGAFYWAAFYSGDAANRAAASDCVTEPLLVTPAPAQVTTRLSAAGGVTGVGGSASDSATLHGATPAAGGTVQYRVYDSRPACDRETTAFPGRSPSGGTLVSTATVTTGTVPPSAAHPFPVAGTFYWAAFYSGDAANRAAASDCATEPLLVTRPTPQVATSLSAAGGVTGVGGSASDSATLPGATPAAGGTVQYRVYDSLPACDRETTAFPGRSPSGGTLVSTATVTTGTVPPSAAHPFPVAGTFYWAAFYSGDAANRAAASDCATEPLIVTRAAAHVTTDLSAADRQIPLGGSASDSATLHGVTPAAGGTVEYRVYDSLGECDTAVASFPPASAGTLVSTKTVTSGAVPASAMHAFPAAGTFYWAAFYSGDPNNRPAASDCVTEPLLVRQAPSQVTTQLSAADGQLTVGGSASDTATLHGATPTASGTVQYRYYDSLAACDTDATAFPGTPPSGGALVSTKTVTSGTVPASAAHPFATTGIFFWAAFYSGDPNNRAAASDCVTEPLLVTAVQSEVTTQLSAAGREIAIGGSASDSATLHGATPAASGTLRYRYYGSLAACAADVAAFPGTAPSGGTLVSTKTVTSGTVPPSATVTFSTAGTFYWAAFYSGDPNNRAAASDCATEPLLVTRATSHVSTRLSAASGQIPIDGPASDTATLHGATATAGGKVQYRLYNSLTACDAGVAAFPGTAPSSGTLVSTETVTSGTVPASATVTFPTAGTFYWAAFYSGDPNNRAAASDCATEPLLVTRATPQVTTRLSAAGRQITVGGSVSDTATLHGATPAASGTVQYRLFDSLAACDRAVSAFPPATGGTLVTTVTVAGGTVPASFTQLFPAVGTFYWGDFYSGDVNNRAAASDCATEPLVVTRAAPQVTTGLSAASGQIAIGGSASDSAVLHGATATARGTVRYRSYDSLAACATDVAAFPGTAPSGGTLVSTVTVTGGVVPGSATHRFPVAGTFYWAAFYSGNTDNRAAASDCSTEPLVVTRATPQLTTRPSAAGGVIGVGGSASDSATLHGAAATAGGRVQYRFYGSLAACQAAAAAFPGTAPSGGTLVTTVTVTGGTVPPSAAVRFPSAGTFFWAAFYSGDASNRAATSDCVTEPLLVTRATPQVTTELSAAGGVIGISGSARDSAMLHGATSAAGGTVQYRLYSSLATCDSAVSAFPPAAGGTLVTTVTVTGGVVPASGTHAFALPGTFYWAAFYTGDANNRAAASDCVTEPLVVTPAPPPPASVLVNMDWVLNGVIQRAPSQNPDFQASLSLNPLIPPDTHVTWGEERFGYAAGQSLDIAVTDVQVPPGCRPAISGHVGTHTLADGRNEFTVTSTLTCDTRLTLRKEIVNPFPRVQPVPLTAWTLTARRTPGERAVISGPTGVTGDVEPAVQYVLAESKVPGYQQLNGPAVAQLAPGATGSWRCVEIRPGGASALQDFNGGSGVVVVQPGQHVNCTAFNQLTRPVPVGPAETGGGFALAGSSGTSAACGLALMGAGALLGLGGVVALRRRRAARSAPGSRPGRP